jgi:hypothetical protein
LRQERPLAATGDWGVALPLRRKSNLGVVIIHVALG